MHIVKKQLKNFSVAHRLVKGYTGKCRNLHGHNYTALVSFSAKQLDQYDFVIDFDDVKILCDEWLQTHWDHAILISSEDTRLLKFAKQDDQKHYVFGEGANTTVETLTQHYFNVIKAALAGNPRFNAIRLHQVEIFETARASACFQETSDR